MRTRTKSRVGTSALYLERVNLAIDHIVRSRGEPLRLEKAARVARFSPFHFHRVFQAIVGETLAEFAKRLRLERALFMMSHARRPSLTSIALDCGFASSSDFSRSFKQRFGVPPSRFDIAAWREAHGSELETAVRASVGRLRLGKLPPARNPDGFRASIRELPARTVAYIRVRDPYRAGAVTGAAQRLLAWAQRHSRSDGQWLGYQWDSPEITAMADCQYHVAVEIGDHAPHAPAGEVGRFAFPPMTVAQVEVRGGIDLELRALQWVYGSWLPRSGYVPDGQPCFEAWIGRPFAHGTEHFELFVQLPVKRARATR